MRTTWNGSLTFGLVSIPVGLAPATKPAARQSDVSFRLLHRECLTPIKQKRWCPKHDRELAPDEIVKGWEASKGHFVIVEEAELEALEAPRRLAVDRDLPVRRPSRRSTRSGATAATSSSPARPPRNAGPTSSCSRRCVTPAPAPSAASCARAASRSASCARGRLARARDAVPRRRRLLRRRDHRGGRDRRGEGARARARAPDHRQPRRRLRPEDADEHLPARPEGAARGQARRRRARRRRTSPRRRRLRRSTCSRRSRRASRRRRRAATPSRRRRPKKPAAKSAAKSRSRASK